MEAEILSISSFNLGVFFLIVFSFWSCQSKWYRKLPEENKEKPTRSYLGVWQKKSNPRSAINSPWHKNQWTERITLNADFSFTKVYEAKDWVGSTLVEKTIRGEGVYSVNKNWILLTTKQISSEEKRSGQIDKSISNQSGSSLLYYYYLEKNLIIPMIYDMGYEEKDFGVKDGVTEPYDETDPNFFHYIKIYAFKEFQSHAYYPEN